MARSNHHSETNEKKILIGAGIVIFIIVALIAYFEWTGRHVY